MNAFESTLTVEERGRNVLIPFLAKRSYDGQFVMLDKGRLARFLQETIGDAIFNSNEKEFWTVEFKIEGDRKYGNFFIETWSNRNLTSVSSHAERGSNPGWLYKLRCDLLFYYFCDEDELYIFDFFKLKQWAFSKCDKQAERPNIFHYPERVQSKRQQLNDTWGRCVPIAELQKAVGAKLVHPKQIPLFAEMDAVA